MLFPLSLQPRKHSHTYIQENQRNSKGTPSELQWYVPDEEKEKEKEKDKELKEHMCEQRTLSHHHYLIFRYRSNR